MQAPPTTHLRSIALVDVQIHATLTPDYITVSYDCDASSDWLAHSDTTPHVKFGAVSRGAITDGCFALLRLSDSELARHCGVTLESEYRQRLLRCLHLFIVDRGDVVEPVEVITSGPGCQVVIVTTDAPKTTVTYASIIQAECRYWIVQRGSPPPVVHWAAHRDGDTVVRNAVTEAAVEELLSPNTRLKHRVRAAKVLALLWD